MSKPILALNSIRGKSGKDTLIEHIESTGLRVFRVAFADILKKECAEVLSADPVRHRGPKLLERAMHTFEKDMPCKKLSIQNLPDSQYKDWLIYESGHGRCELPRSLRWHLQQYGTQYVREHLGKPNEWLNKGVRQCFMGAGSPVHDLIVITDLRLPNEYQMLGKLGAKTVRIVRDWFVPGVDDVPYHISDIALMAHPFDALVVNEWGKPEAMLDQIKELL